MTLSNEYHSDYQLGKFFSPALVQILQLVQRDLSISPEAEALSFKEIKVIIDSVAEELGVSLNNYEHDQILSHIEKAIRERIKNIGRAKLLE